MGRARITRTTTGFGDTGYTYTVGGWVVSKSHERIHASGSIDELSSVLGLAKSLSRWEDINFILTTLQNQLFILASDISAPLKVQNPRRVTDKMIRWVERTQELYLADLEPLKDFILPGAGVVASLLHVARTVARRCERDIVSLAFKEKINEKCIVFINRVSDLLFTLARVCSMREGRQPDIVDWDIMNADPSKLLEKVRKLKKKQKK